MSRYRKIRIRTATREVISVTRPPLNKEDTFCTHCGADVGWLGLSDAAEVRQSTSKEIIREIENGHLHARETADGRLRICRVSILRN